MHLLAMISVLAMLMFRPALPFSFWSPSIILCKVSKLPAKRKIWSAYFRLLRYSPYTFIPFSSQFIPLNISCRHVVNKTGDMVLLCHIPLFILISVVIRWSVTGAPVLSYIHVSLSRCSLVLLADFLRLQ